MVEMMGSDLMRLLVTLIAVFMVSGAMAQKKPTTPSYDCMNAGSCSFSCQFKSKGPSGPIYACKDPKTSKTQKVQCKKPPKQKLPPKITLAELDEICGILTGDGLDT